MCELVFGGSPRPIPFSPIPDKKLHFHKFKDIFSGTPGCNNLNFGEHMQKIVDIVMVMKC